MVDPKVAGCKGKLFALLGLVFVSGMLAGAVTPKLAEHYGGRRPGPVLTEAEKQMAVDHFSQELDLNSEQVKAIEDILDEVIMEQANLMQQFQHSRTSGHDQILHILNADQRKRFQKVLSELGAKRQD